jgi:hypothetical protein
MDLGPIDLNRAGSGPAAITGAAPGRTVRPHTADSADVRPDSVVNQFGNVSATDIAKLTELIGRSLSAPAGGHLHALAPTAGSRIGPISKPIFDEQMAKRESAPRCHPAG